MASLLQLAAGVQAPAAVDEVYVAQELERIAPELSEAKREQLVNLYLQLLEEGRQ
jgi:hypothetical protein